MITSADVIICVWAYKKQSWSFMSNVQRWTTGTWSVWSGCRGGRLRHRESHHMHHCCGQDALGLVICPLLLYPHTHTHIYIDSRHSLNLQTHRVKYHLFVWQREPHQVSTVPWCQSWKSSSILDIISMLLTCWEPVRSLEVSHPTKHTPTLYIKKDPLTLPPSVSPAFSIPE